MGWYERQEIAALRKTLRTDDVYLELGSGVGVVATIVSRLIGSGRVTADQGNPRSSADRSADIRQNGVRQLSSTRSWVTPPRIGFSM